MTTPALSIVIPAHNAANHLRTLPERLAAIQEFDLPIEVLIVISGVSEDQRPGIENLQKRLPEAEVITLEEHLTPGPARNLGLQRASGPHVAFLDVDDKYDLQALVKLVKDTEAARADVGVGSYRLQSASDPRSTKDAIVTGHPTRIVELLRQHAAAWRYVFDRRWLIEQGVRFDSMPLGEDLVFLVDVDSMRPAIHTSPDILYTYIIGQPTQASGRNSDSGHRQRLLEELARRAAAPNCPKDVQRLLGAWFLRSWAVGVRNGRDRDRFGCKPLTWWRRAGGSRRSLVAAVPSMARYSRVTSQMVCFRA